MLVPPSFPPSSIIEPQWFPRPITDSIESNLDLLERLEEDRKRRLRSIANVAARTPIGLGGVEDRAHAGSAGNQSPKPVGGGGANNYGRFRYYPPNSESSASLHTSYQRGDASNNNGGGGGRLSTTPASVTTRRGDRQYRRGTTPRQQQQQSSSSGGGGGMDTTNATRDGTRTPVGGYTPVVNDRDYMNDSLESSSLHRHQHANSSFRSTTSSVNFMSPPLDPRAGGGRQQRYSNSNNSSSNNAAASVARRLPIHYSQRTSLDSSNIGGDGISIIVGGEERNDESMSMNFTINTVATPMMAGAEEYVTPPAMSSLDQTPGHGHVEDVYTARRGGVAASGGRQRRRRRGWDEVDEVNI